MKHFFLLFFAIFLILSSCKTDFDINAGYKDITVVYGLLSQNDNIHYIKINKAYLGDGNALLMATNPDSCTYGNFLEVKIEEWINGSPNQQWYLDTTTIYNKEAGVFYNPKQVLYKFNAVLNENAEYRLIIKNKNSGKIITSSTKLVHNFTIDKPTSMQQLNFTATSPVEIKWSSALYGRLYQLIIRFRYKEKNIVTNDSVIKTLDWGLGTYKSKYLKGDESMSTSYNGQNFYKFLHDNIPSSTPNIIRSTAGLQMDFIISVAADDFNTYMEVSAPSTGVSQVKPEYTNINNGIGLFSTRYKIIRPLYMSGTSNDSLKLGQYTKYLNFE